MRSDPPTTPLGIAEREADARGVPLAVLRGPSRSAWNRETRRRVARRLRDAGLSLGEIGELLGRSKSSVHRLVGERR
jgi:hypothetical protein